VKKSELEHVIRAAKEITGETEFVVIGSQALHGAFPNLVERLFPESFEDAINNLTPRYIHNIFDGLPGLALRVS
jgi:hypothetical protein